MCPPAPPVLQTTRESALRFSFSPDTTAEEVDYAAAQIRLLLPVLRRYTAH